MFRYTLKNIWAYKTRLALSMISIILGVAFLSGTLVFSATIKRSFDDLFATVYEKTDVSIRSTESVTADDGFSIDREGIDRSLEQQLSTVDGVKSAAGYVQIENLIVIGKDGKRAFSMNGPPTLGFSHVTNSDLSLLSVIGKDGENLSAAQSSQYAIGDDEVLVDKATADIKKIKIGDTYKIVFPDAVRVFTVKAFTRIGTSDGLGGAAIFTFNNKQATLLANKGETFSAIDFSAKDGVTQAQVKKNIENRLKEIGQDKVEVLTGKELTEEAQSDARMFLDFFTYVLLGFAIVSFLVALIIIVNSFAIVVAQRKREYALLRAIGAQSKQIRRSVFVESTFVGLFASAIGVITGIGLAVGIRSIMDAAGLRLPAGGLVVPTNAIVVGLVVGTLATVLSALIPAWLASRISPVEALRDSAFEKQKGWLWRWITIVVFAIATISVIALAYTKEGGTKVQVMGMGIGLLLVTVVVSLPVLVRPFTAVVGSRPAGILLVLFGGRHAFGVTGDVARRNNYRNPRRTGRTALALMIGVSLVVFITVLAQSATASFEKYFKENLVGDFIIGDFGATNSLTPERCVQIAGESYVEASSCFNNANVGIALNPAPDETYINVVNANIVAVNSHNISKLFTTEHTGSIDDLGADGIVIAKNVAKDKKLKLGDTIGLRGFIGNNVFTIRAITEEPLLGDGGDYIIDSQGLAKLDKPRSSFLAMVTIKEGVSTSAAQKGLDQLFKDTGTEVLNQKDFRDQQIRQINGVLYFVYGLLALAIIIASIGIVNTMSLSILERRRELGLMRAIGTTKSQVRGFVRFESVIVAVLGTAVGIVFGVGGSFLFIQSLKDQGFDSFAISPGTLISIIAISAVIGALAGAWPAWRATKVDVLKAITVE